MAALMVGDIALMLDGKPVEPEKPRLLFVTLRALQEQVFDAVARGEVACLIAFAGALAAVCPRVVGAVPGDLRALPDWSAAALERLFVAGLTNGEVSTAGRAALEWLDAQLPRPPVVEQLAGNSSAQGAPTTST